MNRAALLVALFLAATAAELRAQADSSWRKGFWTTFGIGGGSNRVSCDNCTDIERFAGGMAWIRAGAAVSNRTLVGGELYAWQRKEDGADTYVRGLQAIVQWYPFDKAGFFGEAGLGIARLRNNFEQDGVTITAAETGISITLGLGYDIKLAKNVWLTPTLASIAVPTATIDTPQGPLNNVIGTIFQYGLGVTVRW